MVVVLSVSDSFPQPCLRMYGFKFSTRTLLLEVRSTILQLYYGRTGTVPRHVSRVYTLECILNLVLVQL